MWHFDIVKLRATFNTLDISNAYLNNLFLSIVSVGYKTNSVYKVKMMVNFEEKFPIFLPKMNKFYDK